MFYLKFAHFTKGLFLIILLCPNTEVLKKHENLMKALWAPNENLKSVLVFV